MAKAHTGHRRLAAALAVALGAVVPDPASAAPPPAPGIAAPPPVPGPPVPGSTGRGAPHLPGYHHLGATTAGEWSGVLGRLTVRDAAVRPGTFDFVAVRFMAKRNLGDRVAWLEAGWAETGWSGDGRQRIYTYDTVSNAWTFYDRFRLRDADQIWLYVHTGAAGDAWQAWLYWDGEWQLLASRDLPLGPKARMEQYLEVHVDQRARGEAFAVPEVAIDNVHVKPAPTADPRPWGGDVATAPSPVRPGRYCVRWHVLYHNWRAGDCAPPPAGRRRPGPQGD